jgi:hypothetical protein
MLPVLADWPFSISAGVKARNRTTLVLLGGLACLRGGEVAVNRQVRARFAEAYPAGWETSAVIANSDPTCKAAALLGGFRSLVADMAWLRANVLWERRDMIHLESTLRLVTAVDPRPLLFWLNGARMIAYDFPAWRIAGRGGEALPAAVQDTIRAEQARRALAWLDRGEAFHPHSPALLIERANISLYGGRDLAAAADWCRQAAEIPGAPAYAARLHAELLRRLGRRAEALAWLMRFHARRSREDPHASADGVLELVRELETELSVPARRHDSGDSGGSSSGPGIGL